MMLLLVLFPLLLTTLVSDNRANFFKWLIIGAPIPALLLLILAPTSSLQVSWIFFGLDWSLDGWRKPLFAMTTVLWTLASISAAGTLVNHTHAARYLRCWLLTLTGNLGLLVANDIASFYTCFALMTFAAYGLVIDSGSKSALKAGKVYIAMAILGEAALLSGLLLAASLSPAVSAPLLHELPAMLEGEQAKITTLLLFFGFGVKAGLAGVHWWLPLAHPAAPTAASAVLSGAMIKAGLVGWLMTLPLGFETGMKLGAMHMGWLVITFGLIAIFAAAVIGVLQSKAKTVLAYSSISQMGILVTLIGASWLQPALWPTLLPIIALYAAHHGFNKGALFLTVGLAHQAKRISQRTLFVLSLLPALSLAGFPLTTGFVVKGLMKDQLYQADFATLSFVLTLGAIATTALMLRYLWQLKQEFSDTDRLPDLSRYALVAAVAIGFAFLLFLPTEISGMARDYLPSLNWWSGVWPVLVATLAVWGVWGVWYRDRYFR